MSTTTSLTIRVAADADLPALVGLFGGFMEHYGEPLPPAEELAAAIRPALHDSHAEVLIAEDADGTPLAYTHLRYYYSVWTAAPEAFVEDLFVVGARRDGGIGRAVLNESFARARSRGCRRIRLDTNERNERGRHLYEALGFICERASYQGGRQLYYTKVLDA